VTFKLADVILSPAAGRRRQAVAGQAAEGQQRIMQNIRIEARLTGKQDSE
jgi:hypothetical protein